MHVTDTDLAMATVVFAWLGIIFSIAGVRAAKKTRTSLQAIDKLLSEARVDLDADNPPEDTR